MDHEEQFGSIKTRSLFLWYLISVPFLIIAIIIAKLIDKNQNIVFILISLWVYGVLLCWLFNKFNRHGINFGEVFGKLKFHYSWVKLVFLSILLLCFSLGIGLFTYYLSSLVNPYFLRQMMKPEPLISPYLDYILAIVIAPIVEEIFFRGYLLHRLSIKWGVRKALIISALIFALLHLDLNIIGRLVMGMSMAILYIKTKTLIASIISHSLYNGILFLMKDWGKIFGVQRVAPVITFKETQEGYLAAGLVLLLLSLPWMIRYLYKNWPRDEWQLPYFVRDTEVNKSGELSSGSKLSGSPELFT